MAAILKNPLPFDTVSRVVLVASSVSTTLAFGTTALLASYTTPLSEQLTPGPGEAAAVQAHHRPLRLGLGHGGHQGLELHQQRAAALQGGEHHPTGHAGQSV